MTDPIDIGAWALMLGLLAALVCRWLTDRRHDRIDAAHWERRIEIECDAYVDEQLYRHRLRVELERRGEAVAA